MFDLSIIIPTRNRVRTLEACLKSIVEQQGLENRQIQIIVSDGASTDGTAQMLAGFTVPENMTLIRVPSDKPRGPGENRNAGAQNASGGWLAFIDDDCTYAPGALARFFDLIQGPGASQPDIVRPKVIIPNKEDITLFTHQPAYSDFTEKSYGGVFFIRFGCFKEAGGFSTAYYTESGNIHLGEDTDFLFRCYENGCSDRFDAEIQVLHPVYPGSWKRPFFDARRVRVSMMFNHRWKHAFAGKGMNTRKLFGITINREMIHRVLSVFFWMAMMAGLASATAGVGVLAAAAFFSAGFGWVALLASYLSQIRRYKPGEIALFSVLLPVIMLVYGINTLWGLKNLYRYKTRQKDQTPKPEKPVRVQE